ncbi:hypothetical protein LXA43DRAFT_1010171, partial [Ganoderma leucocontextum]
MLQSGTFDGAGLFRDSSARYKVFLPPSFLHSPLFFSPFIGHSSYRFKTNGIQTPDSPTSTPLKLVAVSQASRGASDKTLFVFTAVNSTRRQDTSVPHCRVQPARPANTPGTAAMAVYDPCLYETFSRFSRLSLVVLCGRRLGLQASVLWAIAWSSGLSFGLRATGVCELLVSPSLCFGLVKASAGTSNPIVARRSLRCRVIGPCQLPAFSPEPP